jgi:hypothetical protein
MKILDPIVVRVRALETLAQLAHRQQSDFVGAELRGIGRGA